MKTVPQCLVTARIASPSPHQPRPPAVPAEPAFTNSIFPGIQLFALNAERGYAENDAHKRRGGEQGLYLVVAVRL